MTTLPHNSVYRSPLRATTTPGVCPDAVAWARTALGFEPDDIQRQILGSTARHLMLCCTRQFGKSQITAIKALHYALAHPGALIVIAAPSLRQSGEWMRKTRTLLRRLGLRATGERHHDVALVLENGSRLVGLTQIPENVRGFSAVSLALIDEAAFVSDELYTALNPMLAVSRGGLWLMSTPGSQYGFFYDDWHRQDDSIARFRVPATECARISPEFLAEQRLKLGETEFRREYLCEFVPGDGQKFTLEMIRSTYTDEYEAWDAQGPLFGS